ncbi:MAG: hypothetical protein U9Q69_06040 [Nanoarchaeota archaeon]|nr:hypothetical protein [Nanoarchaeota archaeon]
MSNRKWCQKKSSDWYDCRLLRNINYRGDILYCNALGEEAVEAAGYDLMMRRLLTNTLRLCDNNPDEGIIIFKQYLKQ